MSFRKIFKIAFFSIMFLTSGAEAQQVIGNRLYKLGWDNDVFMMTDHYYTQGLSLSMVNPFLKNNPVNLILLKPKQYEKVAYGFTVDQRTYTPKDIRSDEIQYSDRPYAGVLVFSSQSTSANIERKVLFKAELDIGVMGPASGAGQVQYHYHDLTDNSLPNGWGYQQYNWPVLNYNFEATKEFYSSPMMDIYGKAGARVGTLHDDVTVAMLFRFGKMNNYLSNLGMPLPSEKGNWQLYFNAEPSLTVVGYNATMQGGWHRNPKIHYIEYQDISPVVYRLKTGLGLIYKNYGLDFNVFYNSKEFKEGTSHWFTGTRLFLTF